MKNMPIEEVKNTIAQIKKSTTAITLVSSGFSVVIILNKNNRDSKSRSVTEYKNLGMPLF